MDLMPITAGILKLCLPSFHFSSYLSVGDFPLDSSLWDFIYYKKLSVNTIILKARFLLRIVLARLLFAVVYDERHLKYQKYGINTIQCDTIFRLLSKCACINAVYFARMHQHVPVWNQEPMSRSMQLPY